MSERTVMLVDGLASLPESLRLGVLAGVIAGCWGLLALVDSSLVVLVHVMYVPVVLAALWFSVPVAVVIGVFVGFLTGPLAPAGLVPASHADAAWLLRMGFFVLIGVLAAGALREIDRRRGRMQVMYESLTRLYTSTLRGFTLALEMKDEETWAHSERVATNARTMGGELGLPPDRCEALYWAGYLHDVGKLATPSSVLLKPSALSDEQFEVVKQHAAKGQELLLQVSPTFHELALGVRHHHERWDGRGYPDGLKGTEIPVFGRILAVVDVFEALTSDRPYRPAWSEEDASAVIEGDAGTHFEPALSRVFLALLARDRLHVEARHGQHPQVGRHVVFNSAILSERPVGVPAK